MPAWATVVLTLGSAFLGALAAVSATMLQSRNAHRERVAHERVARRESGAQAVAPVWALALDADPTVVFVQIEGRDVAAEVSKLEERWRVLRAPLLAYAAGHPKASITEETNRLIGTLSAFLVDLRIVASGGRDGGSQEDLTQLYFGVRLGVGALIAAIRDEPLVLGTAPDLPPD
jgi:hypothetical protein